MDIFDRKKIKVYPISEKLSKSKITDIVIDPENFLPKDIDNHSIELLAQEIINARNKNKPVIVVFGAHLIKNGLVLVIKKLIEDGFITHLATNGAGSIHDWEFAYHGETEEDVEKYVNQGKFGIWDELGKYINLALISGAQNKKGYGESIGEMIHNDRILLNNKNIIVKHEFKEFSIQEFAFSKKIPFTVHPGFGYDIIYSHPNCDGASIGIVSDIDFLKFVNSVYNLEGGVYISIGSAIMSPMIFEKSLSMARNVRIQENKQIKDFFIAINDIKESKWNFMSDIEPQKNDPRYYERFGKSFKRMGAKKVMYIQSDNRDFLVKLYKTLKLKK